MTKYDELNNRVIALAKELLKEKMEDYESGVAEGIYDKDPEQENRYKENHELVEKYESIRPEVYILVEGGLVQGVSSNCRMAVDVYDVDQANDPDGAEYVEVKGTPLKWDQMINEMTDSKEIIPVL